jgi:hypothetical protein
MIDWDVLLEPRHAAKIRASAKRYAYAIGRDDLQEDLYHDVLLYLHERCTIPDDCRSPLAFITTLAWRKAHLLSKTRTTWKDEREMWSLDQLLDGATDEESRTRVEIDWTGNVLNFRRNDVRNLYDEEHENE